MAAGTPTFNDMYVLSQCAAYQNRVQASLLQACVNVSSEGWTVPFHRERQQAVVNYLASPTALAAAVSLFANSCATDSTSIGAATAASTNYVALTTSNVAAQQALVTDADISNAIGGQFNAYIREPGF